MHSYTQGRAQFYSVSKKRQGLSTNTERERQEVAEEIKYIVNWVPNPATPIVHRLSVAQHNTKTNRPTKMQTKPKYPSMISLVIPPLLYPFHWTHSAVSLRSTQGKNLLIMMPVLYLLFSDKPSFKSGRTLRADEPN